MEIKSTMNNPYRMVRFASCALLFLCALFVSVYCMGQVGSYTVKNGRMYISVNKKMRETAIDSFIKQFDLQDLGIKRFIRTNNSDSIKKQGWEIQSNTQTDFVISKPLLPSEDMSNPADKIIFSDKHPSLAEMFPAVN